MAKPNTVQINLRIAPELKEAAEQAAAEDHRSLTSLIVKLLSDHCKATGHLPAGKEAKKKGKAG
jgi:hypothetical protein